MLRRGGGGTKTGVKRGEGQRRFVWRGEEKERRGTHFFGKETIRVEENFGNAHSDGAKESVVAIWEFKRTSGL